jgi:hypothetical protein
MIHADGLLKKAWIGLWTWVSKRRYRQCSVRTATAPAARRDQGRQERAHGFPEPVTALVIGFTPVKTIASVGVRHWVYCMAKFT